MSNRLLLLFFLLMIAAVGVRAQDAPAPVDDAAWGLRFAPPAGWTPHQASEGYLFVSPTQQGILAVLPHEARTVDALRAEARQGLADGAGTALQLQGDLEAFGENGLSGVFGGWIEGSPAQARVVGLVSPHGRGATVLAATAPQHYSAEIAAAADAVARSIAFTAPAAGSTTAQAGGTEEQEWHDFLQGCRLSYFNSYDSGYGGGGYIDETTIDLCLGYFHFGDHSETVFNASDLSGSDAYSSSGRQGAGRWDVVRQGGESVLQLQFHDGSARAYVLGYEDGKTFLDGRRWLRTCNPNDTVVEARPQCR